MKIILFIVIGFVVYRVLIAIIAKKLKVKCPQCGSKKVTNFRKLPFDKEWNYSCGNCFCTFTNAINNDEL